MVDLVSDFPAGPLDKYRKSASFDWKKLTVFLNTRQGLEFKGRLHDEILRHPALCEPTTQTPSLDEQRRLAVQRMLVLKQIDHQLQFKNDNPHTTLIWLENIYMLDANIAKYGLAYEVFLNGLRMIGTERHQHIINMCEAGEITGCFSMTEIAHGSNIKAARTTATYDPSAKEFVLHTPDFEAAKCWTGNLAQTATYAVVFAQLVTPDGVNRGGHFFVVNIRDPKTHLPHPGIIIGDMGEKIGLNGIDNGFMMFNQFRIPYQNLLNKISNVTPEGEYQSSFDDHNRQFGATFMSLSRVRIKISGWCTSFLIQAVTIAVRYAAVRKQFAPDGDAEEELSILEYQSHQYRLLPRLAAAYALKIFCLYILEQEIKFGRLARADDSSDSSLLLRGLELHAIASASKVLASWTAIDAAQECREACGGHGYLKASRLGEIRNNSDPACTYEGDNYVLNQQTSNWLVKFWPKIVKGEKIITPLNSVDFLNEAKAILQEKFRAETVDEVIEPKNVLRVFQWLICYLTKATYEKAQRLARESSDGNPKKNAFWAKNNSQIFLAKNLSLIYVQHLILQKMYAKTIECGDAQIRKVLLQLFSLYATFYLEKHISTLYAGGYATGPDAANLIQESVLKLCKELKDDAIALVDVIAPPDFILNSVLGYSDGEVYKHLERVLVTAPGAFSRPKWWKEIAYWKEEFSSKL